MSSDAESITSNESKKSESNPRTHFKIGSRKSKLAMVQSE